MTFNLRDAAVRLWEQSPDAVLLLDAAGQIVLANAAVEWVWGYPCDDIIGLPFADNFLYGTDRHVFMESILAYPESDGVPSYFKQRLEVTCSKAGPILCSAEMMVVPMETHELGCFAVYLRDSPQPRFQSRLDSTERAQERAEAILNNISDPILLIAPDLTIQQTNIVFNTRFGWQPDEWFGKPITILVQETDREAFRACFDRTYPNNPHYHLEINALCLNGSTFPADVSISLIHNRHFPRLGLGYVCSIHDISERKKVEAREQLVARGVRAVVEAADELIAINDMDSFFRRAVELAREKFQVERCSIFILDSSRQSLVGTFGTDQQRRTTDERQVTIPVARNPELMTRYQDPWWVTQKGVHTIWNGESIESIGAGWIVTTIIRIGDEPIGIFSNDAGITGTPTDPAQQEVIAIYCSLLGNIYQRKLTETNLHLATSRMTHLIEHLESGILLEDENRFTRVVNQTFCDMFAIPVPPASLVGMDCRNNAEESKHLFRDAEGFVSRVNDLLNQREKVVGEELLLADGRVMERDYLPIFIEGRYYGHLWQYHDTTQRVQTKRRQERLFHLEQTQRTIANLFLHTDEADPLNKIIELVGLQLRASRVFVARFRVDERLLDNTHEWCAPGVAPKIQINQALPYEELFPNLVPTLIAGVISLEHADQLPEHQREQLRLRGIGALLALPIHGGGRLAGFIGISDRELNRTWLPEEVSMLRTVSDGYARILERKQAEESLIEARDSALRNARLKSELMSNMSHEIRTPMTGVLGMLELLRETDLSDWQREFADDAFQSAHRLLNIINEVLDFSKIEAGHMLLRQEQIDLRGMVREVIMTLAPLAIKNEVRLISTVAADVPQRIVTDSTRLNQVLMNITSNGVKFTQHGEVHIRISVATRTADKVGILFEVQDTGIGIAPAELGRIFDSFVQAGGTSARKYGGTGLGLTISKQLVELMGGQIEVESEQGKGSFFRFQLNLLYQDSADVQDSQMDYSGLRAVVCDANMTIRVEVSQILRDWGLYVVEVESMDAVTAVCKSAQFAGEPAYDLIFLGVQGTHIQQAEDAALHLRQQFGHQMMRRLVRIDHSLSTFNVANSAFDNSLIYPINRSHLQNVLLPAHVESKPTEPASAIITPQAESPVAVQYRILLAEDDPHNQNIIITALTQLGYKVDLAVTGEEALNLLDQHSYNLILMDIHMPVMDGKTATAHIRNSGPAGQSIPIIAVTASVLIEEQMEYERLGINAVIAKPFSLTKFRETIDHYLKQEDT
jgi:PAS domain S-box-containing protein